MGSITVQAGGISSRYTIADSARTNLAIVGTSANCSISVKASKATRIQGSVELKGNTSGSNAGRWGVSGDSSLEFGTDVSVTKGHSYTLSFAGFVYSSSGSEYVTASSNATSK